MPDFDPVICENCGRTIGRLEAPHVFNENVVCAECHTKQSPPLPASPQSFTTRPTGRWILAISALAIALIAILGIGYWVWSTGEHHSPVLVTKTASAHKSITGAVWVNRSDGSTNILRGQPVYLISTQVKHSTIVEFYAQHLDGTRKLAQEYVEVAKGTRDIASMTYVPSSKLDDISATLQKLTNDLKTLDKLRENAPDEMNAMLLCVSVKHLNYVSVSPMAVIIRDGQLNSAMTDIDGKYVINDIPPGGYYLCSYFVADYGQLSWLIGVHVSDASLTVDLHNNNTVSIAH